MDTRTLKEILAVMVEKQNELTVCIEQVRAELRRVEGGEPAILTAKEIKLPSPPEQFKNLGGRPQKFKTCTVPGCKKMHVARGLCASHYSMQRRAAGAAAVAAAGTQDNKDLS